MATVTAFKSSSILSISEVNDDSQVDIVYHTNPDKTYTYLVNDVEGWETELQDTIDEDESVGSFVNRARRSQMLTEVWVWVNLDFLRGPSGPFFVGNEILCESYTQT